MKRRTERVRERMKKRLEREAGMKNPSGESKYAMKKRGVKSNSKQVNRPSWFTRLGFDRSYGRNVNEQTTS